MMLMIMMMIRGAFESQQVIDLRKRQLYQYYTGNCQFYFIVAGNAFRGFNFSFETLKWFGIY